MASKYWLKLWHEMIDDPKVARLPDSSYRRFVECILLAGELDEDGFLPPVEDASWRLRIDETTMRQDMTRLALAGLVELKTDGDTERWFVTNFQKRQAAVSNAERKKQFRLRETKKAYYSEFERVGNVSGTIRSIDTDTDTDTDTDVDTDAHVRERQKKTTHTPSHPVYDIPENLKTEQFETAFVNWFAHKTEQGQPMTQRSGDALLCKLGKMGSVRAVAAIQHSMAANWKSVHEPKEQGDNGRSTSRMIPDESPERKGGLY